MLLNHATLQSRKERIGHAENPQAYPLVKPYAHLCREGVRDLLRPIRLLETTRIELDTVTKVDITALDARHCPGSCMFLISDTTGTLDAVLHTGDIRISPAYRAVLELSYHLAPYLPQPEMYFQDIKSEHRGTGRTTARDELAIPTEAGAARRALRAIYIDTEGLLNENEPPESVRRSALFSC